MPAIRSRQGIAARSEGAAVLAVFGHRIDVRARRPVSHVGNLPPVAPNQGLRLRAVHGVPTAARPYGRQLARRERGIEDRALVQDDLGHAPLSEALWKCNAASLPPGGRLRWHGKSAGLSPLLDRGFW